MKTPDKSIIEKVLNNEATIQEVKSVTCWLKTKEGMSWLANRMDQDEQLINIGEEQEWVDHKIPSETMYENIMAKMKRQRIRQYLFRAAALLIPLVLFISLTWKLNDEIGLFEVNQEQEEINVPLGDKLHVMLQDGSSVYLNSGSCLKFPKKFSYKNRKVQLSGEGWFEVQKNRHRPFIVELDKLDVEVLGTSFNLKAYHDENNITISLKDGSVKISSSEFQSIKMIPGDEVVYDRKNHTCRISHSVDIHRTASWQKDTYEFEQSPLEDIVKVLSRIYDVQFIVHDKEVQKYCYTIKIKKDKLSTTLQELEKISPVHFILKNDSVSVYSKQ